MPITTESRSADGHTVGGNHGSHFYKREALRLFKILSTENLPPSQRKLTLKDCQNAMEKYIASAEGFKFVAEGRANAVFKILTGPPMKATTTQQQQNGQRQQNGEEGLDSLPQVLIRAPLSKKGAEPYGYERLQEYRERVVEPAVGVEFLVPQVLVRLTPGQTEWLDQERSRDSSRAEEGSYVAGGLAMVVQDMRPSPGQVGFEFKPKWLAQSPIAPHDAVRCRTCAREASRLSKKAAKGEEVPVPLCPLGLMRVDADVFRITITFLQPQWPEVLHDRLQRALEDTRILVRLRDLQIRGDGGNAMFENPESEAFGLAMTLRDCTVFIRMSDSSSSENQGGDDDDDDDGPVEIKLADVDEKNAVAKKDYWQKSHTDLVAGGFYHGTETPYIMTDCFLDWP